MNKKQIKALSIINGDFNFLLNLCMIIANKIPNIYSNWHAKTTSENFGIN